MMLCSVSAGQWALGDSNLCHAVLGMWMTLRGLGVFIKGSQINSREEMNSQVQNP